MEKGMTTFWMAVAGAAFLAATTVYAEDQAAPAAPSAAPAKSEKKADGEVDISDIENQYWKSHDKDFEVIQNKQFTKAGRVELTPIFGIYQRVDFQDTKTLGLSGAYHFSEMLGVELMGYKMMSSDSFVLSRFQDATGTTVDFNEEHYYMGASLQWTPIYGKFQFLGKKISHFDLYVAPGLGAVKTVDLRPAPSIAVGQKFWITNHWNFRLEYRVMRYNDTIEATHGTHAIKNGGSGSFSDTITDQNLIFGISYLFN